MGHEVWKRRLDVCVCVLVKVRRAHHCSVLIVLAPSLTLQSSLQKNACISPTHTCVYHRVAMSPYHRTAVQLALMLRDDIAIYSSAYRKRESS